MQRVRAVAAGLGALGAAVVITTWGVAGAASTPASGDPTPSSDGTATVSALVAALNAHDVDRAMALFANPATVQDDRRPQSPEQIRGWLGQLVRENLRVDLRGQPSVGPGTARESGESVAWSATLWHTGDRESGAENLGVTVRAVVLDRRVAFLSIRPESRLVPAVSAG